MRRIIMPASDGTALDIARWLTCAGLAAGGRNNITVAVAAVDREETI